MTLQRRLIPPPAACAVVLLALAAAGSSAALAQDVHVHVSPAVKADPHATTEFPTIQMALDHAPEPGPSGRLFVHIAPGVYRERVWVSPQRARTTFLGEGADASQVQIVAGQSAKTAGGTFLTATVQVYATDFQADRITITNDAGPVGQAVALAINADRAIVKNCRILGDQDTLFANFGRQLYIDSYLEGGVDFLFGNAAAVFENDEIHIIRPGYLTAQSRTSPAQATGYVIDHSRVTAADLAGHPFYLGRPWRAYSRVVFLHTELPASLSSEGWMAWASNTPDMHTPFYGEFGSTGAGAAAGGRVSWSHQLTAAQAAAYAPGKFLAGPDHWDALAEAKKLP